MDVGIKIIQVVGIRIELIEIEVWSLGLQRLVNRVIVKLHLTWFFGYYLLSHK